MPGFEALDTAIDPVKAQDVILPEEVEFVDPWADDVALGIVLADIDSGIAYEQSKSFTTSMENADDLIRGYVKIRPWPNTDKARSALSMPVVLEAIEKIIAPLQQSLFGSGRDPFLVTAVGKTKPEAARAWQSLLRWAVREADFREGSRITLKTILTYGFGAGIHGWKSEEVERRKYRYTADKQGVELDPDAGKQVIAKPTYEAANLRNIIFDPACASQDARKGKFYAIRIPTTAYDLDALRADDTYKNIPTREELSRILANKEEPATDSMQPLKQNQSRELQAQDDKIASSKDPLQSPLELIEYHTRERIITVLQRTIVIRNDSNKEGELNIVSCAFIDVLNSLFGWGIARLLQGEQRFQQGVLNTWVDSLALILNPAFQQIKGMSASGQNISISPGKVVSSETELKPLVVPDVSAIAQEAIESSAQRAFRRVGAEGGVNMPTQALRTGTGVNAFQGDIIQRLQYFMDQYLDLVFVPVLRAFLVQCCNNLTPAQMQQILSDENGKAYEGEILDVYNADTKIEIIAGVRLTTKQAAAQSVPVILQVMSTPAILDGMNIQGINFVVSEFVMQYLTLMGWDTDKLFRSQTQEEMARAAAQNQAKSQSDGRLLLEKEQHSNDLDSIDAKAAAQAGLAVLKSHMKLEEQSGLDAMGGNQ